MRISRLHVIAIFLAIWAAGANAGETSTLTTIYSFSGPDGANPAGLLQGADGNFYGTTSANSIADTHPPGWANFGTVFRITPEGALTNLHVFSGASDGAWPQAGLVQTANGSFYGTTYGRGAHGWGTVFWISPAGDFKTFASFDSSHGWTEARLIQGSDGNFYTMGNQYLGSGFGTVVRVAPDGAPAVLVPFDGVNGYTAYDGNPLLQGADGNIYGATELGGPAFTGKYYNPGYGTLFKITPEGKFTSLFRFNGANGFYATALVQGADGSLYGTTSQGGLGFVDNPQWGGSGGHGTIFKLTLNGVFTTLALFDGANGERPLSLMQARDGNFYGATARGGADGGYGTIFRMTADGALTSLFSFNRTNGASPYFDPLLEAADGSFYGTTTAGGASNRGTIFRLTIAPGPPAFDNVSRTGDAVTFTWAALTGRFYQVQHKGDLTQSTWSDLGNPVIATNNTMSLSDVIGPDRRRFYRVMLLP